MNRKIFVGNVPFHCSKEEFQEHFKHLDGFETADIIKRYNSKLSRGFGFIVFKNELCAKKVLESGEMKFKDRMLRFSPYMNENNNNETTNNDSNKKTEDNKKKKIKIEENNKADNKTKPIYRVYVSNIDNGIPYQELKKCISKSGINVSTCFVNVKNDKTTGIVFLDTLQEYTKLLETKIFLNGKPLIIKPYKKQNMQTEKYSDAEIAYREGFKAGNIVGFQQGFQERFKQDSICKNN